MAVRIRSDGALHVALASAIQLKSSDPRALFRGTLERSLKFQVVMPVSSDYYLIFDNRRGSRPVQVEATISAQRGPSATPKNSPKKPPGELEL